MRQSAQMARHDACRNIEYVLEVAVNEPTIVFGGLWATPVSSRLVTLNQENFHANLQNTGLPKTVYKLLETVAREYLSKLTASNVVHRCPVNFENRGRINH